MVGCVQILRSLFSVGESINFHHVHNLRGLFSSFLFFPQEPFLDYVIDAAWDSVDESLGESPSEEEILEVLRKIKGGKAAGKNGVLPEMIKCCMWCWTAGSSC